MGDEHSSGLLVRIARIVVPWVLLIVVVAVLWSIVSDYRASTTEDETSETVQSQTSGVASGEPYVTVLTDGLNLRSEASTSGDIVVVLNEGQQLVYLDEVAGWYHVKTTEGAEGWVAAGGRYTELVRP